MIGNGACEKSRRYATPSFGLPEQKVALHVGVHFYIDKELMVIVLLFLQLLVSDSRKYYAGQRITAEQSLLFY